MDYGMTVFLRGLLLKWFKKEHGRKDYLGGQRLSSRNSSILLVSVFTSLP